MKRTATTRSHAKLWHASSIAQMFFLFFVAVLMLNGAFAGNQPYEGGMSVMRKNVRIYGQ